MLTQRKKVGVAILGSALIHVALLFVAGVIVAFQPSPGPVVQPKPLHLELVRSESPTPELVVPTPQPHILDNSRMQEAEHPPDKPVFEGDRNSVAASEGPATGDKPLPSQLGREAPNYAFDPAPPTNGVANVAATDVPDPPATAPPPPKPSRAPARPPEPAPTPLLARNDATTSSREPTPAPEEMNPYDPSFRSTEPPPPTPVRSRPRPSAYRPMEDRTASTGDITNVGSSSVDAVATPYGRYRKRVLDAIRAVWTQSVDAQSDLASLGTVKVHLAIDRSGHIHTPQLLSNTANEALASITMDAINAAVIPPIPPEVVETMNSTMLQLDVTFECL